MKFFHPRQITLLDGMFRDAMVTDLRYVLSLEPDRLAAPFLREAGLSPTAETYGNWESGGLDGHTAGHYLSATALLAVATSGDEPRDRLDHLVAEIARAQEAIGTGYVGGVPGGAMLFESLRGSGVDAARSLGSSEHWVPWYNLHKTFAGLLDAVELLEHEQAATVLTRLADWWVGIAETIDDDAFEVMLDTEFGGMNDLFARLAASTGRRDLARMAERFSHRAVLQPLLERRDALTGLHANTQIPKVVGYASTAALSNDRSLFDAADYFWHQIVERRSVAIGGNSVREHFHALEDFTAVLEDREGPETCNTYNMLKLTKVLAETRLAPEYLDYAERAMYNHQLSSQHPDHGGFVYFTPMRPRHYRVYSQADLGFWCCVGTGMEAQAKYGELVFGNEGGALALNLFIPAILDAPEFGGRIRVETAFPADELVTVTLDLDSPRRLALRIRVPGWSGGLRSIAVNGAAASFVKVPGAVILDGEWSPGDTITFRVPLEPRAERLPDASAWQAFAVGPVVLAAREGGEDLAGLKADDSRMGHIARGRLLPFGDLPIVTEGIAPGQITPSANDGPLHFRLSFADRAGDALLEPFATIHDERYTIYWPAAVDNADALAVRRAALVDADRGSLALDRLTIDEVAFGEQQPESDHGYRGRDAVVGAMGDRRWRSTRAVMSVVLTDPDEHGSTLRVGYQPTRERTRVAVTIDGVLVAEETVEADATPFDLVYELPAPPSPRRLVEFSALDGLSTPGIASVRLLRWA